MSYVIRTRTIVERAEVEDDPELDFDARAAVAVARQSAAWEAVSDTVSYEVHDDAPGGCTVVQITGRAPKEG